MRDQHTRYSTVLIFLSAIGFLDAFFLSYEHFKGLIPPCTINFKCDVVAASTYSSFFGIPVSYLGLLYYLPLFIGSFLFFEKKNQLMVLKLLTLISGIGFLFSLYLTYIQGWVLNAWCIYCISSAISSTLFFISTIYIGKRIKPVVIE
ncbi:MAG: vitamin K epoxide reductase family protein [Minisyncoccia bacterium]